MTRNGRAPWWKWPRNVKPNMLPWHQIIRRVTLMPFILVLMFTTIALVYIGYGRDFGRDFAEELLEFIR